MLQRKPGTSANEGIIGMVPDQSVATRANKLPTRDEPTLDLEQIASDALEQLRQFTQEHAALSGQILALERQVRTLLIERLELSAQVASLQRENAHLRGGRGTVPAGARPIALSRPDQFAPLRGGLGLAHRPPQHAAAEETLLSVEATVGAPAPPDARALPERAPVSYTLIAQPFGRFSDLGRFQTAIQALPGVQNARVRRFAQGTLEMRLDYDGQVPLQDALTDLALTVEGIEQISPQCLVIRLRPDSLN